MRLVETDNFGRDCPNESFLRDIPKQINKNDAKTIADILNNYISGPDAQRIIKVVENEYILQPGFEP